MSPNEYLDSLVQQGALPPDLRAAMNNPNFQGGVFQRTGGPEGPGTPTFMYRQDPTPSPAQQSLADARSSQFEAPKPFDWGPQVPTMADVFGTDPQAMAYGEQLKAQLLGPAASQYQLNQIPLSQLGEPGQAMLKQFEDRKKNEFNSYKEKVKHFEDTRKGVAEFGDVFLGIGGSQGAAPGPQGVPGVRNGPLEDATARLQRQKFEAQEAEKAEKVRKAGDQSIALAEQMAKSISNATSLLEGPLQGAFESGWMGRISKTIAPSGDAARLERIYSEVKGAIARGTLQAMRESSPTGGALGAISERELQMLEDAMGALTTDASTTEQRNNLFKVKQHFDNMKFLVLKERERQGEKLRAREKKFLRDMAIQEIGQRYDAAALEDKNAGPGAAPAQTAPAQGVNWDDPAVAKAYEAYVQRRIQAAQQQ